MTTHPREWLQRGLVLAAVGAGPAAAAQSYWVMPRESQYAQAVQRVGVTDITVTYHRPLVKGRTIWGCETTDILQKPGVTYACLVPNGQVWRAGANDATTVAFDTPVNLGGRAVPAGTFALFMIPGTSEWTVILNRASRQWGAFTYDEKQDVVRVPAKPVAAAMQEALLYLFRNVTPASAELELWWDRRRVAFEITVDTAVQTKARAAAQFTPAMGWWAAGYWLNDGNDPQEALKWVNASLAFGEDLNNLMMKSTILGRLERYDEAIATAERILTRLDQDVRDPQSAARTRASLQRRIVEWQQARQQASSPPAVAELVAAHVTARGGRDAWAAVTTFKRRQSQGTASLEATWRRKSSDTLEQIRMDGSNPDIGFQETLAFDGRLGWATGSRGSSTLQDSQIRKLREDVAGMVELFVLDEIGLTLGTPIADTYEGKPVWRIAAKFREGREMTMYFDAKTWLEVARAHRVTAPDGLSTDIWFTMGSYRKVGGLLLPHEMNGGAVGYEINGTLPAGFFSRGAGALSLRRDASPSMLTATALKKTSFVMKDGKVIRR